jgi:hypothetical protein
MGTTLDVFGSSVIRAQSSLISSSTEVSIAVVIVQR